MNVKELIDIMEKKLEELKTYDENTRVIKAGENTTLIGNKMYSKFIYLDYPVTKIAYKGCLYSKEFVKLINIVGGTTVVLIP